MSPPLQVGSVIAESYLCLRCREAPVCHYQEGRHISIHRCEKGKERGINKGSTQEELREEAALNASTSSWQHGICQQHRLALKNTSWTISLANNLIR